MVFGYATGLDGNDLHGAGALRFATKVEGNPLVEKDELEFTTTFVVCAMSVDEHC